MGLPKEFEVLKAPPLIPDGLTLENFYFLSNNPVLNPDKNRDDQGNPEQLERLESLEREEIRQLLKLWHGDILKLQECIAWLEKEERESDKYWARRHARKHWHLVRIRDHVPAEVSVQALMDLQVNDMDPDFSYTKWYGENCWVVDDPVPEIYAE